HEKRHSNIPADISPCLCVKEGDHVTVSQCSIQLNNFYNVIGRNSLSSAVNSQPVHGIVDIPLAQTGEDPLHEPHALNLAYRLRYVAIKDAYDRLQVKLAELNGGSDGGLIKELLCDAGEVSQPDMNERIQEAHQDKWAPMMMLFLGTYIDQKCLFNSDVFITIMLAGTCHIAKKHEKRHSNIPADISPCLCVKEGDHVTVSQCSAYDVYSDNLLNLMEVRMAGFVHGNSLCDAEKFLSVDTKTRLGRNG
ncbi:40S ribosomal protein S11, partial [Tanacetum coccineum]